MGKNHASQYANFGSLLKEVFSLNESRKKTDKLRLISM